MNVDNWDWIVLLVLGGILSGVIFYSHYYSSPQSPLTQSQPKTYRNIEEWEVKRDKEGRLLGITVHREAEENAGRKEED